MAKQKKTDDLVETNIGNVFESKRMTMLSIQQTMSMIRNKEAQTTISDDIGLCAVNNETFLLEKDYATLYVLLNKYFRDQGKFSKVLDAVSRLKDISYEEDVKLKHINFEPSTEGIDDGEISEIVENEVKKAKEKEISERNNENE